MDNQIEQNAKNSLVLGIVSVAPITLLLILAVIILPINYELILLVGILAIFTMPASIITGIISIVFAAQQLKENKDKKATIGIFLSSISFMVAISLAIFVAYIMVLNS